MSVDRNPKQYQPMTPKILTSYSFVLKGIGKSECDIQYPENKSVLIYHTVHAHLYCLLNTIYLCNFVLSVQV